MDLEQRKQVGERIQEEREARGWSRVRLAEEAAKASAAAGDPATVTENTIISMEKGRRNTHPAKLRAVKLALGIPDPEDRQSIPLDRVPVDVADFLKVVAKRLSAVEDPDHRARILAAMYPRIFTE